RLQNDEKHWPSRWLGDGGGGQCVGDCARGHLWPGAGRAVCLRRSHERAGKRLDYEAMATGWKRWSAGATESGTGDAHLGATAGEFVAGDQLPFRRTAAVGLSRV